MFHWTEARVLAVLDAGVLSVSSFYNRAYTLGVRRYGAAGGRAHSFALAATVRRLTLREEALFATNVEAMLATLGIYC
jgi:hypothetical protein